MFTYALRLDEWLVYFYAYAKYYYGFQRRKAMYLDDSNYAYESVKSAHTEPVLVADKSIRIIKEHHSKSFKTKLI